MYLLLTLTLGGLKKGPKVQKNVVRNACATLYTKANVTNICDHWIGKGRRKDQRERKKLLMSVTLGLTPLVSVMLGLTPLVSVTLGLTPLIFFQLHSQPHPQLDIVNIF